MLYSYQLAALIAAVALGLFVYSLCVRSKAVRFVSVVLILVCALLAFILWEAAQMILPL